MKYMGFFLYTYYNTQGNLLYLYVIYAINIYGTHVHTYRAER